MRKILLSAAALVALAAPGTAQAVDVSVDVKFAETSNGQWAWVCTGRANPLVVDEFNLWCANQAATGFSPVLKATAGLTATPTVCYRVTFRWGGFPGSWASRDDCVSA